MPIAYCYIRIGFSNKRELDGGLEAQRDQAKRFYDDHLSPLGYDHGGDFIDPRSAYRTSFRERESGGRLWERLKSGDFLIVPKSVRAFRDRCDMLDTTLAIIERGVELFYQDIELRSYTTDGRIELNFLFRLKAWSRLRFSGAYGSLVRPGQKFSGGPIPIGMMVKDVNGRKIYVNNPEERRVMGIIYDMAESGRAWRDIVRSLKRRKLERRGGGKWTIGTAQYYYEREKLHRRMGSISEEKSESQ